MGAETGARASTEAGAEETLEGTEAQTQSVCRKEIPQTKKRLQCTYKNFQICILEQYERLLVDSKYFDGLAVSLTNLTLSLGRVIIFRIHCLGMN